MKQTANLIKFYAVTVLLFLLAKPAFLCFQPQAVRQGVQLADLPAILWHGLPLDLATAGYLSALPWLLWGVSLWIVVPKQRIIYQVYVSIISFLTALILVADTCLYSFWGIKLDGTIWTYMDQPGGALASVTTSYALGVVVSISLLTIALAFVLRRVATCPTPKAHRPALWTMIWVVLGGLLFLGIRGGVGKGTANVGMVYYSDKQLLNHAAVNPVFSIVASLKRTEDFAAQYNFFEESERARIFSTLHYNTESQDCIRLLRTSRPNVLIILMEGCGAQFVEAFNPKANPQVTPHLNQLAREGVMFSQCYANSFRTDRGTLSTLSGFPAFPDVSVMKHPSLCAKLPSIARSLRQAGYSTSFLYGGDINFTNTNGYLLATGYQRTDGDSAFPLSVRRTHDWGVTDAITFDTLAARVQQAPLDQPWHMTFLTLASHEPWKVPYARIPNDEVANSMAYLDHCIGQFIDRLRQMPQWDNTLVILLPDHGITYPEGRSDADEGKSHIPLIWTGGAVKAPRRIDVLCNQSDLAATLLGQMDLPHADFRFSRDVLSATYTHPSAVHTWSEGIYYKDESGITVLNLLAHPVAPFREHPHHSEQRVRAAEALLQTTYDHLGDLSK